MRYNIADDAYLDIIDEKRNITFYMEGGIQSVLNIDSPLAEQVGLSYSFPAFDENCKDILVLGLGLGGNILQIKSVRSDVSIDAVDIRRDIYDFLIDQKIFDRDQFSFIHDLAEEYLAECKKKYDCIIMDLVQGEVSPKKCVEVPFLKICSGA